VFVIDEQFIRCTRSEYQLLMELLRAQSYVTLTTLVQHLFESALTRASRRKLTKCVSHMRDKLFPVELGISCLVTQGYMLIQQPAPPTIRKQRHRTDEADEPEA
jgi:hypothetical protein